MTDNQDEVDDNTPQSKFEWRPGDITILSDEEAAAAEAEYQELLAEMEEDEAAKAARLSSDAVGPALHGVGGAEHVDRTDYDNGKPLDEGYDPNIGRFDSRPEEMVNLGNVDGPDDNKDGE